MAIDKYVLSTPPAKRKRLVALGAVIGVLLVGAVILYWPKGREARVDDQAFQAAVQGAEEADRARRTEPASDAGATMPPMGAVRLQ